MSNGSILLRLDADGTVSGIGSVSASDIVRCTPTSLGSNTAGTFTMYFDGSDVGLTTTDEDIDAISFAPNGNLIVSTVGPFSVTGVSGNREDLVSFAATSLGTTTSGSWTMYFDGSDVGLGTISTEQINEIWIDTTGKIHITTSGSFSVTGLSGNASDIFICTPGTLGNTTTCTYSSYWLGASNGFSGEDTDGLYITP